MDVRGRRTWGRHGGSKKGRLHSLGSPGTMLIITVQVKVGTEISLNRTSTRKVRHNLASLLCLRNLGLGTEPEVLAIP